jgi:hypothetical protein
VANDCNNTPVPVYIFFPRSSCFSYSFLSGVFVGAYVRTSGVQAERLSLLAALFFLSVRCILLYNTATLLPFFKKKKKYILTVYSSTILLQFKLAWRKHQKLAASMQSENWMKS